MADLCQSDPWPSSKPCFRLLLRRAGVLASINLLSFGLGHHFINAPWQNRSSKCLLNLHLLSQPPEHIRLLATFSGYIIPAQMDPNDRIGQTTCDSSWAVPNSSKFFRDPLGGNLSAFTILYDVSRIRGGASLDWY